MHLTPTQIQLTREPGGGFPFGNPPQDQDQLRRGLVGLGEDGAGQHRVEAVALLAAIGRKGGRTSGGTPLGSATAGAAQAFGVQVLFQPGQAGLLVEQLVDGKVDHTRVLSCYCTLVAHEPEESEFHCSIASIETDEKRSAAGEPRNCGNDGPK